MRTHAVIGLSVSVVLLLFGAAQPLDAQILQDHVGRPASPHRAPTAV